jgi:hypothetical protein
MSADALTLTIPEGPSSTASGGSTPRSSASGAP